MKKIMMLFLVSGFMSVANAQQHEVKVHAGTELLHIINYLAGVYLPAVDKSTYLEDVNQWFGKHKNHPAVQHASALPYNDFVDLGWCIEIPSMKIVYPEDYGYFSLLKSEEYLDKYLELCRQFAIDTDFWHFFQQQKPNYEKWEKQFTSAIEREKPLSSLYDFYQIPLDKTFFFSISPMGVVLRANIYQEKISPSNSHFAPIIIPYDLRYVQKESDEPSFVYDRLSLNNNVWHEASHIYWEELNDPYEKQLFSLNYQDSLSRQIKTFEDDQLNLYFYVHEVISDGIAIFLKKKLISEDEAEKHLLINEQAGSPLYRQIVNLFDRVYWQDRKDRNFQDFIPEIIDLMKK